jgi:hypothetical protein
MVEERKSIHARVDLNPDDPLYDKLLDIEATTGATSHSQALRYAIRRVRLRKEVSSGGN